MKKDDIKYCIVTEGADFNFPYLRVMLNSLLKHNPWVKDNIIIMTCDLTPLSLHNREILKSINDKIQFVEIDAKWFSNITVKNQDRNQILLSLYRLNVFNLKTFDVALYINSYSVCVSSITPLFEEYSDISLADTGRMAQSTRNPNQKILSSELNSSVMLVSDSVMSDSIFKKYVAHISKIKRLTDKTIDQIIQDSLNLEKVDYSLFSLNLITKKSKFPDSKFRNYQAIQGKACIINMDIELTKTANANFMFKKINSIWSSYNQPVILDDPGFSIENRVESIQDYIVKKDHAANSGKIENFDSNVKISIIIPAYKAGRYIEECLMSIQNQDCKNEIEILVGIDNCQATLSKIKSIKDNYPNLKVYYSDKSVGPYVMRNSLVDIANHDNILFFDADDIMKPNMISMILKKYSSKSPIRFKLVNFIDGSNYRTNNQRYHAHAHGVFFSHKSILKTTGGFKGWLCGADTEFIKRCEKNRIIDIKIDDILFYRRIHPESLTQNRSTKHGSKVRQEAVNYINRNRNWKIPIQTEKIKLEYIK